ncbi:MAG: T9SS type A sorting domain-containing protein [Bacteroidales bacterium]|nr:T9SS type A sorting domain-containing protein [Bacteroidales bacterium]
MKRFLVIIFPLLFSNLITLGNAGPPMALLREIMFDNSGNWSVELYLYQEPFIDSIWIESSSGGALVTSYTLIAPDDLTVINNSNLSTPITFNSEGDYIIIRSGGSSYSHYDSIAFGNYPGSILDCINTGVSYAFIEIPGNGWSSGFSIDTTPTMGYLNDTSGAVAYFSGTAYKVNGEVFTGGEIVFVPEELSITIGPDGTFDHPIFARRYQCDEIRIIEYSPYSYADYTIIPMEFCALPGSTIQEDFVTTGLVGTTVIPVKKDPLVIVSPNPFSSAITFFWAASAFNPDDITELCIFDQQGKQLLKERIRIGLQKYQWNPEIHLPSGIYIYQLIINGKAVSSGKIVRI